MTFDDIIAKARQKLGQSLKDTFEFLLPLVQPGKAAFNDLITLEARFNRVNRSFNLGAISSDENNTELNRINLAVAEYIDGLTAESLKIDSSPNTQADSDANLTTMLEKLRESYAEIERLKAENELIKSSHTRKHLKIRVECDPAMEHNLDQYSCSCLISNYDTGEEEERDIPLREEPGGIIATIHNINPSDYIQITIKGGQKQWRTSYFSPLFFPQNLTAQ
ncbi:MAG: hypothetical protein AAFR66_04015 [Bacteroidota bacterium]